MANKKVLVPTNFNPQSEVAVQQCIYFSENIGADIYLLHVIEGNKDEKLEITVLEKLNVIVKNYKGNKNISFSSVIDYGKVIQTILKLEKEIGFDFIFIGTEPETKPFKSTTLKLIDEVNCPVFVFPGRTMKKGCNKILLPLDLTKETTYKINVCVNIAKVYGSVVHIITASNLKNHKEKEKFNKEFKFVKNTFDENNIKCITEILKIKDSSKDDMANSINEYSESINADLVVIMIR
jgi:nucleotide-binding universal stress UspA family protein